MKNRGPLHEPRLKIAIALSADELKAIDSFRFAYRMPNRRAAVRELLQYGCASAPKRPALDNVRVKSSEWSVLKSPAQRDC